MNYRDIAGAAREQGWRIDSLKNGDMWYSPDGRTKVLWHRTPSDHRAEKNFLARMRQGGLRWPPRRKRG
jgi:hypothetical protein